MKQDIRNYAFKEEVKIGFEIVDLGRVYARHQAEMTAPHRTDFYHIIWFEEGPSRHFIDFQPVEIVPRSLVFINKDAVHSFEKVDHIAGKGIVFLDSFFCKNEQDAYFLQNNICFNNFLNISNLRMSDKCLVLKTYFEMMFEAVQNPAERHHADYLKNLLHNFLIQAERTLRAQENFEALPAGIDLDYTGAFRNLLNLHFKNSKNVTFYAEQLNITENRLYHATMHVLGKSPKQMITERLVLEAKRLLAHSPKTVKEISFELGFEEPTNFSQFFKKYAQVSPNDFRKEQQHR